MKKQISLLLIAVALNLSNGAQASFYSTAARTARQTTPLISRHAARSGGLSESAINAARTYRPSMQQFMPAARTFATKAPEIAARPNYSYWQQFKNNINSSAFAQWIRRTFAEHRTPITAQASAPMQADPLLLAIAATVAPLALRNDNDQVDGNLRQAILKNDIDMALDALKKGANLNIRIDGETPLMIAARLHKGDIVRTLMGAGADVNAKDNDGKTPLILDLTYRKVAPPKDRNIESVKELLKAGADVNAKDKYGQTALSQAVLLGDKDGIAIVKELLKAGADVNATDNNGRTARYRANMIGAKDIVEALRQAGAED